MAIAYSASQIVLATINSGTFLSDISTILLQAGWSKVRDVTLGSVFKCRSPQGLLMRLLVQDKGDNVYPYGELITLQIMSEDESLSGLTHLLRCSAGATYQCVAGCCQLFISLPGIISGAPFSSLACGIPYIPTDKSVACTTGYTPPSQLGWSCGSSNVEFIYIVDWRLSRACFGANSWFDSSTTVHDRYQVRDYTSGPLALYPPTPTYDTESAGVVYAPDVRASLGTMLYFDTLMGWGNSVKGQLWDSFLGSAPGVIDQEANFTDTDDAGNDFVISAICWSINDGWCSLYLITGGVNNPPGATEVSNYVY